MMNEIVRAAGKSVKLIDVLSCCEMAKEARRLSNALHHWSACSLDTLAETVAAAEVMVATPEYEALVGALEADLRQRPFLTSNASSGCFSRVTRPRTSTSACW